jgi:SET domain-containing protein
MTTTLESPTANGTTSGMHQSSLVCVRQVKGKGRGVFARTAISKGAIIEHSPVLIVPNKEMVGGLANPILQKYFYIWTRTSVAVSLGYGSLYNHSYRPNANYEHARASLIYRALRDIKAGEEITINYNGDPKDRSPMAFDVV